MERASTNAHAFSADISTLAQGAASIRCIGVPGNVVGSPGMEVPVMNPQAVNVIVLGRIALRVCLASPTPRPQNWSIAETRPQVRRRAGRRQGGAVRPRN